MARTPLAPAAQAISGSSQRPAAGALSFLGSGALAARWEPKRRFALSAPEFLNGDYFSKIERVCTSRRTISCTGSGVMNAVFELCSRVIPERALACCFNLEYLLVGGQDDREEMRGRYFMLYDWMAGGWGGRADRDGCSATSPIFGVGLAIQSCEAQKRLTPVLTSSHQIAADSGGGNDYTLLPETTRQFRTTMKMRSGANS
jgi:hypothetical protein